jgi:hypothetical protein
MPTPRQRAAAAAADTKSLFETIPQRAATDPTSYFYPYSTPLPPLPKESRLQLRSAIIEGDPFDIAVDWQNYSFPQRGAETVAERAPPIHFKNRIEGTSTDRILVLNTANEKKAGGDWEGGTLGLGAEESLARRSNLVQTLCKTDTRNPGVGSYYPIPPTGGIYSPNTVVLRGGHEKDYVLWPERDWTVISVVSVAAVRRPKTDESGMRYSFSEEKELQKEKMKTILRIAAQNGHINLVLGGFGSCGPGMNDGDSNGGVSPPKNSALAATSSAYKNPIKDVCDLWEELLCECEEFQGYFKNVVFAVSGGEGGGQKEFRKYFG